MPHTLSPDPCNLYPPAARHYNSDLSIWLSVDPMSDKYPSMSPYTYCANNPVRLVDPNGEDWFENENTGDVYYALGYSQGDEHLIDGVGWKWMGRDDMFGKSADEVIEANEKGAIGEALPEKNGGQSKIQMLKEGNEKQPIMHEIGHTLGLNHSDGVMNKFCTYKDEGIFLHHIGGILNHAGFDVTAGKQCAAQIGPYKMVYNKEPFKGELWRK